VRDLPALVDLDVRPVPGQPADLIASSLRQLNVPLERFTGCARRATDPLIAEPIKIPAPRALRERIARVPPLGRDVSDSSTTRQQRLLDPLALACDLSAAGDDRQLASFLCGKTTGQREGARAR